MIKRITTEIRVRLQVDVPGDFDSDAIIAGTEYSVAGFNCTVLEEEIVDFTETPLIDIETVKDETLTLEELQDKLKEHNRKNRRKPDFEEVREQLRDSIARRSLVIYKHREWCHHCEYEVGLAAVTGSKCPVCGRKLTACSECATPEYDECTGCRHGSHFVVDEEWQKEHGGEK